MSYIQDKLDEFDKSELSERIRASEMFAINHGFEPWMGIALMESLNNLLKDYHNHIVEKVKEPSYIRKVRFESDGENTFDYGYDTKTKEILSLLQDTNPKE